MLLNPIYRVKNIRLWKVLRILVHALEDGNLTGDFVIVVVEVAFIIIIIVVVIVYVQLC
jgi:hypothetical protein